MKVLRTFPDPRGPVVDYLVARLGQLQRTATVGVGVPAAWTRGSGLHVQVDLDGTPRLDYPVVSWSTVRITVWSTSTGDGADLANLCLGLLAAHPGGGGIASGSPLTGVLPATDSNTGAQLASVTARIAQRSVPVT